MLQTAQGGQALVLTGAEVGPLHLGAWEVAGHPVRVNPILRTGGRPNDWEVLRVPEPNPGADSRGGVGTAELASAAKDRRRAEPFPKIGERPAPHTLPKNTFHAKSREEVDPLSGGPHGESQWSRRPPRQGREDASEGSALPSHTPLL